MSQDMHKSYFILVFKLYTLSCNNDQMTLNFMNNVLQTFINPYSILLKLIFCNKTISKFVDFKDNIICMYFSNLFFYHFFFILLNLQETFISFYLNNLTISRFMFLCFFFQKKKRKMFFWKKNTHVT